MRVVVCGDDGVGKSSLITSLFKDKFVPNIEDVLPQLFFPKGDNTVAVIDTTPQLSQRPVLLSELRQANVLWLVYSDHYTMERISLFWLPFLRSNGVNLPVILCQNKMDLYPSATNNIEEEEEIVEIMREFKEIESFVRCSAKEKFNVTEAFYLCQRAVTHPLAPLFDSKEGALKPAARAALSRVFFICDQNQTGYLNDSDFQQLQNLCFSQSLPSEDIAHIHEELFKRGSENYVEGKGISLMGYLTLNQLYCEQGRHETIWGVLRRFHYTDSLSLDDRFLHPKLDVTPLQRVELSPDGYQFLVDLFTLFDQDNDGGLNQRELDHLFTPTPGVPPLWRDFEFPNSIVRNENGDITLQGWLAQWSMSVYLDHQSTLAYFAMLGYESKYGVGSVLSAVRVTKPTRKRNPRSNLWRSSTVQDRNVFNCFVVGKNGVGKSGLMSSFLNQPFQRTYSPTLAKKIVVNSVEMEGGKQCYLIMQELGDMEQSFLEDSLRLDECDVLCMAYDSSDPDSFSYLVDLRKRFPLIDQLPMVFAALKADLDRQQQRSDEQPDAYTANLGVAAPLHISAAWPASLSALFVQLVDSSMHPGAATPMAAEPENESQLMQLSIAAGVVLAAAIGAHIIWRRSN